MQERLQLQLSTMDIDKGIIVSLKTLVVSRVFFTSCGLGEVRNSCVLIYATYLLKLFRCVLYSWFIDFISCIVMMMMMCKMMI